MRIIFFDRLSEKSLKIIYKILGVFVFIVGGALALAFVVVSSRLYFYPLKYKQEIVRFADEFNIDEALVFAFVRVESGFNPNAQSEVGAKGLMQITDKTGEYIAQKLGVESYDLFDENTSLKFGCYYIRYLLDKFEAVDTAIVAYNAGEGNVREWLSDSRYSEDGINLKVIPYSETREYLKKIKKSFSKYKNYYKNSLDKR